MQPEILIPLTLSFIFSVFLYLDYRNQDPRKRRLLIGSMILFNICLLHFFPNFALLTLAYPFILVLYILVISFFKSHPRQKRSYIIFGILATILIFIIPILLFLDFYNLMPYFLVSFGVMIVWILAFYFKFLTQRFHKPLIFCPVLGLSIFLCYAYRTNPTVYLQHVSLPAPVEGKKDYWNTDILKLLKRHEQVMVLELLDDYPTITSIDFQYVRKVKTDHKQTYQADALVNGSDPVTFKFTWDSNLPSQGSDEIDDYDSMTYQFENFQKWEDVDNDRHVRLDQVHEKNYQEKLKKVKISYYLEPDIYKNFNYKTDKVKIEN